MRHWIIRCVVLCVSCGLVPRSVVADSQFPPNSGFVEEIVFDGVKPTPTDIPSAVAFAPDGRIFIAYKGGRVGVFENGALLNQLFIDLSEATNPWTDRGLLGIAVHPEFPKKPYVYLAHTWDPPGIPPASGGVKPEAGQQDGSGARSSRVIRVTADASKNYAVAVPGSELVLLGKNGTLDNIGNAGTKKFEGTTTELSCMKGFKVTGAPVHDCLPVDHSSHSVGTILFAADGSLFVSNGDGGFDGSSHAVALRALNVDSLGGKVLRINPDTGDGLPDNPFFQPSDPSSNRSKVWAMGLRNPFRMAIHPETSEPYIGDVGSSDWEEVNIGKGASFGWPCYEGGVSPSFPGDKERGTSDTDSLVQPSYQSKSSPAEIATKDSCAKLYNEGKGAVRPSLFSYYHPRLKDADGKFVTDKNGNPKDAGSAITGLSFYRGASYPPQFRNGLFISDYSQRWIRYIAFNGAAVGSVNDFAKEVGSNYAVVQLLTGPDSNLYALMIEFKQGLGQLRRFRYTSGGVNTPPIVVIDGTPNAGAAPLNVTFSSAGTVDPEGQPLKYAWDFGDGGSSSEPNPTYTYTKVGVFEATLTATETTPPFASNSKKFVVQVGGSFPIAVIENPQSTTTFGIGETISYAGRGEFGGSAVSSDKLSWSVIEHHNEHTHLIQEHAGASGSFEVEEHADAVYYDICLTVRIDAATGDRKCVAIQPRTTQYTFATDPQGLKLVYVDEQREVSTPYLASPIHNSRQAVSAPAVQGGMTFMGWTDGVSSPFREFVTGTEATGFSAVYRNLAPTAVIATSTTAGKPPLEVSFNGGGSADPEGEGLSYLWKFGDGGEATGASVTHTYPTSGAYTASLVVTDKLGAGGVAEVNITVGRDIVATPTPSPGDSATTLQCARQLSAKKEQSDRIKKLATGLKLFGVELRGRVRSQTRRAVSTRTKKMQRSLSRLEKDIISHGRSLTTEVRSCSGTAQCSLSKILSLLDGITKKVGAVNRELRTMDRTIASRRAAKPLRNARTVGNLVKLLKKTYTACQ